MTPVWLITQSTYYKNIDTLQICFILAEKHVGNIGDIRTPAESVPCYSHTAMHDRNQGEIKIPDTE